MPYSQSFLTADNALKLDCAFRSLMTADGWQYSHGYHSLMFFPEFGECGIYVLSSSILIIIKTFWQFMMNQITQTSLSNTLKRHKFNVLSVINQ
jgi:hypothetical protein